MFSLPFYIVKLNSKIIMVEDMVANKSVKNHLEMWQAVHYSCAFYLYCII